jgi:ATP-dependent DNA helicase RecG
VQTTILDARDLEKLLSLEEGHFVDLKATAVAPSKLTRSLSAFANADGGTLYVGIGENKAQKRVVWEGFQTVEEVNGHLQAFEELFPLGTYAAYEFLRSPKDHSLVLQIEIGKTPDLKKASNGTAYLRRGAQNLPQTTPEQLQRLQLNKVIISFETSTLHVSAEAIEESPEIREFIAAVIPHSQPGPWLRKQRLIYEDLPTVAGLLLFSSEPQIYLPHASVKVYHYNTTEVDGSRETLSFDPITIEGNLYSQIRNAVEESVKVIENIPVLDVVGFEKISYPREALHEIITNAVIHRDYSLNNDIHVRMFNNRVEVISPGTLPGHVTARNILRERASRNSIIVRLINKFPNPPNKNVGESLNTAFAMRKLKLRDPIIEEQGNYVKVSLRHEKLAKPEEIIMDYLHKNDEINNIKAREICHIGSENVVKSIFIRLIKSNQIEKIPGRAGSATAYRRRF